MTQVFKYIKPYAPFILLGIILKILGSCADIVLPLLLSDMVDRGIPSADRSVILGIGLSMLIMAIFSLGTTITSHYMASRTSQKVGQDIRDSLYAHLQKLSLSDTGHMGVATLTSRCTYDIEKVSQFVTMSMRMAVRNIFLGLGGIVMALYVNLQIAAILLVLMTVIFFISGTLYYLTRKIYAKIQAGLDKTSSVVREGLSGIKTIKAFNKTEKEVERFVNECGYVRKKEVKAGMLSAALGTTITLISNIGIIIILISSGYLINNGKMELGGLIAIVSYINIVIHTMQVVPHLFIHFSRFSASAYRIGELFSITPSNLRIADSDSAPRKTNAAIEFDGVTFRYDNNSAAKLKPTLQDISFSVPQGSTLAIIGETGAGKSTLVSILSGLYMPQQGQVRINGQELRHMSNDELRRVIRVAQQRYDIFTGSIKENVILNREHDHARMDKVLMQAQLWEFCEGLDNGIETKIYQSGRNLSGGQRQRLSVARVFYNDGDIFVFDDVASALDYQTNRRLQEELKMLTPSKTIVIVAQRINAISHADQIIVLDKGKIAGMGTHAELLAGCDIYRNIYNSQKGALNLA